LGFPGQCPGTLWVSGGQGWQPVQDSCTAHANTFKKSELGSEALSDSELAYQVAFA